MAWTWILARGPLVPWQLGEGLDEHDQGADVGRSTGHTAAGAPGPPCYLGGERWDRTTSSRPGVSRWSSSAGTSPWGRGPWVRLRTSTALGKAPASARPQAALDGQAMGLSCSGEGRPCAKYPETSLATAISATSPQPSEQPLFRHSGSGVPVTKCRIQGASGWLTRVCETSAPVLQRRTVGCVESVRPWKAPR